jgi:hypothetical protein
MIDFNLGQVVATHGALEVLDQHHLTPLNLLQRYCRGDWGSLPPEDAKANEQALVDGGRLFASYPLSEQSKVWVITESDRSVTTLLLPDEY